MLPEGLTLKKQFRHWAFSPLMMALHW